MMIDNNGFMIGKENVIDAMKLGARFFVADDGLFSYLKFQGGSAQVVHGHTVKSTILSGQVKRYKNFIPMFLGSDYEEFILREGGRNGK